MHIGHTAGPAVLCNLLQSHRLCDVAMDVGLF